MRAGHLRARDARIGYLALALLLLAGAACGKKHGVTVATLVEDGGPVEGTTAGATWKTVPVGTAFTLGDAVRTGADAFARLRIAAGGTIRMSENSLVRFRPGAPATAKAERGAPEVSVELGQAEIAEAVGLSVQSPTGHLRVERGSRVRIDARADEVKLEVVVGRALVTGGAGPVAVDAGQGVSIKIGGAIVERFDLKVGQAMVEPRNRYKTEVLPAKPTAPPSGDPPSEAPAGAPSLATAAREARPAVSTDDQRVDVTLTAGDSATIHNDRVPLAIRLRFDQLCTGEGQVELGKSPRAPLKGNSAVVVRLRAGRTPYRVRCVGESAPRTVEGVLSLKRDSGNAPLARQAPSNTIEADGRRYTVLFQSRPPVLTLAWSAAAGAAELELHIDSDGQARTLHAPGPTYRLASGALGEGTHTWWYVTKDGRTSPRTTLAIHFDNTAPTAQFFRGSVAGGPAGAIAVDGVAVQGSKVSAAGQPLTVDEHGRFRAAVLPLPGDVAVAVHIESPRGGSHYYIRRKVATP